MFKLLITLLTSSLTLLLHSYAETLLAAQNVPVTAKNLDDLEVKYDALKRLLLGNQLSGNQLPGNQFGSVETMETLLKLVKLSTTIRRPFHGRAVALVKILYSLDQKSDNANSLGRNDLQR